MSSSCWHGDGDYIGWMCNDLLSTWWWQFLWSTLWWCFVELVNTHPLVHCMLTCCKFGVYNPFSRQCDNLFMMCWQQPSPLDCVITSCQCGDNKALQRIVWLPLIYLLMTILGWSNWSPQFPWCQLGDDHSLGVDSVMVLPSCLLCDNNSPIIDIVTTPLANCVITSFGRLWWPSIDVSYPLWLTQCPQLSWGGHCISFRPCINYV